MHAAPALPAPVERFITRDMHRLKGWLNPIDARIIALADSWQRASGVRGDLCEIGVYHGRGLVLFGLLAQPGETAFGVDLFDLPDAHTRGRGSRDQARAALARFCDGARCELITKSSLELTAEDLRGADGEPAGIRLFCVDGGHEREIAEHDFRFAEKVLAQGGVVVVDDFFNRRWPGVSEAVNAVFAAGETALRPFAVGQAKVYFATGEFADRYRAALKRDWRPRLESPRVMFGEPVAITPLPSKWERLRMDALAGFAVPRHFIARCVKATPVGRLLWAAGLAAPSCDAGLRLAL